MITRRQKKRKSQQFDDFSAAAPKESPSESHWWDNPPKDMESMLLLLQTRATHLKEESEEGEALRSLLASVQEAYDQTESEIQKQYPLAYFKPSYEQSLLLNCWIWGIDFPVCFSANRIGKTTVLIINGQLWIFPNNPDWEMFAALKTPNPEDEGATFIDNPNSLSRFYWDLYDRPVQVLPRPSLKSLELIRSTLILCPELAGDPTKSHLEPENREKFARLQELLPQVFSDSGLAWPYPPIPDSGTIWLGAPDNDFHRDILFKEWKRWLPAASIKKWSETDLFFDLSTAEAINPCPTNWRVICKSYESEDTKWSGSAVYGIILTEGLPPEILNEVKMRIKVNGFGSWDYTPYEARNIGSKTALAFDVFKGKEQLPLRSFVFTRFSARKAPAHILPTAKKDDLVRMWDGKKEGDARLDGIFYSTSPVILSRLERPFHCIQWSRQELFDRYPNGQIYRGLDPGYDHPTVCCWGYLVPGNIWFIYRYYSERGKTIGGRCEDIIKLSGNSLKKNKWGSGAGEFTLTEVHNTPQSEVTVLTAADYHMFKTDETTGNPYSLNYIRAGLIVTESIHMAPKDRAIEIDNKLDKSQYHRHPITNHTPGSQIYFLINGEGVELALGKMEALFWERLAGGPNKGEAKDEVPSHKDDELDATCYLVCGPYTWTTYRAPINSNWVDEEDLQTCKTL